MALQSDDLVALGFGLTADQPPPPGLQPRLGDGIHLRYAPSFTKGPPWYGLFLFRRLHQEKITACLARQLAERKPLTTASPSYAFSDVTFQSTQNIVFIDEFPAPGTAEIVLPVQGPLNAQFAQAPVNRVTAKIGFRGTKMPEGRVCGTAQFLTRGEGNVQNPLVDSGVTFVAYAASEADTALAFGKSGYLNALRVLPQGERGGIVFIELPVPSELVTLAVSHASGTLGVVAYDQNNHEIVAARRTEKATQFSLVTLSQPGIKNLGLLCDKGEIGIHFVFYCSRNRPAEPVHRVRMIAKDGSTVVAETVVSGQAGDVVAGEVAADRITDVEFQPDDKTDPAAGTAAFAPPQPGTAALVPPQTGTAAPVPPQTGTAALVDLCWQTVADARSGGWQQVPNYPYPMALPVAEPSYPCVGKPADLAAAQAMMQARVVYGAASVWSGTRFTQLHDMLQKLVVGGPGGGPMNGRTDAFANASTDPADAPSSTAQNILQLIQLASLDPAMAQVVGLYWLDAQVVPGQAYDYIVLADHQNAFNGHTAAALTAANGTIPSSVDAWITSNHVAQPRAPLGAPDAPIAWVLPDTAVDGTVGNGRGAVGLSWTAPEAGPDYLAPDAAVRYIAWRFDYGDPTPTAPTATYNPLNANAPYIVGAGGTSSSQTPLNWPPLAMQAVDRKLADGWYGYALSGIDIWGRYSTTGQAASWWQWYPAPTPLPWYYQGPAAQKQLHGYAVHVLDKTPPPPPAAVEATALDPDDDFTYERDGVYASWANAAGTPWWNGLTAAQRAAVLPLRVRWRWYAEQQAQHPDTREFRIYFNPGSTPPDPDRFDPLNWQERVFVCDYNDNVTSVAATANDSAYRGYEVLLPLAPPPGVPPFQGVALAPTLANPLVYANISVSAADSKIHTADQPKWNATPWGGRTGNESLLAAAAKIYRVWRTLPAAPGSLLNDDRVWATKADYHSHSFYTFRWAASPSLMAHVYQVVDETLFMVERAHEEAAALDAADIAALQTIWTTVPQALLDQLNGLRALKATVSNSGNPADAVRRQHDADWQAACAALSDGALRGLAVLPLHEASYVRLTATPVDDPDVIGPDDAPGYVPNPAWRAYKAMFDGRARNRYFLRATYIDGAHNEGPLSPPTPPIYLPPVVPPKTPVIVKVTGGDRQAIVTWTTANAEAGGSYTLYRTDDDYRLRDVRLMDLVVSIPSTYADSNTAQAAWSDGNILGGRTYYYCLVYTDVNGNASAPSQPVSIFAPDELPPIPPSWTGQDWMIQNTVSNALQAWPSDGVVPAGYRPVLRLKWEASTAAPSFIVARRRRGRLGWSLATRGDGPAYADTAPQAFVWVDVEADPTVNIEYRIKLRNAAGMWARVFAMLQIAAPQPPLSQ